MSVFIALLPVLLAAFFMIYLSKKPLYISPIPSSNFKIKLPNAADGKTPELSDKLSKAKIEYNSIVPQDNGMLIQMPSGEEIIFSNSKSLDSQISSLQLIERSLTIEGKRIARLDFRFDSPVLTLR